MVGGGRLCVECFVLSFGEVAYSYRHVVGRSLLPNAIAYERFLQAMCIRSRGEDFTPR